MQDQHSLYNKNDNLRLIKFSYYLKYTSNCYLTNATVLTYNIITRTETVGEAAILNML
jgi:hypothetical protein